MAINESRLRQILREEARRVLREGTSMDGALEITGVAWDDIHNDPGTASQGGNIVLNFIFGEGESPLVNLADVEIYVTSYSSSEDDIIERITDRILDEIEGALGGEELPEGMRLPGQDDVRAALGGDLRMIMDELADSERRYQEGSDGDGWSY